MKIKKRNNFWIIFIIFLTSFLLWVIFCFKITTYFENDLLKNYYNISEIDNKKELDLSKFWLVYNIIKNNYFDADQVNKEELVESTVSWLVKWLNDRHSEYLNPKANQVFTDSLSGDFEWIWAVVNVHPLWVQVDRLIKGSPAKESDIRVWDIIMSANWTKLEWLTVSEAVDYIKWNAWTLVDLEIIRAWEQNILTKNVIRKKIKIPSVNYEEFENNTWYISLNMFWDDTSKEFQEALYYLRNTNWIIIDLRDNWGGYLISAVEILSNLIEKWEILVITRYKDNKADEYYKSMNNWNIYNWKIIVLINENSASASEIVAWTLREDDIAIVVWKKSYWKGSVQKPFVLSDWSMVKLTIAKWFTPKGVNIDEEWIKPEIEVDFLEEDYINFYDRQKEEAKKILNDFIENWNINEVIKKYTNEAE
jgi:carboxyl-terminal processing protease